MEQAIGTDINVKDTDGDGYNDKQELQNQYNLQGSGELNIDQDFIEEQKGRILLQTEKNGEAWYVNPEDGKRYFLGRPIDAFNTMREIGIGISNKQLRKFIYTIKANKKTSAPIIVSPRPGTTLSSSRVEFNWKPDLENVHDYRLSVGEDKVKVKNMNGSIVTKRVINHNEPDLATTLKGFFPDIIYVKLQAKIDDKWKSAGIINYEVKPSSPKVENMHNPGTTKKFDNDVTVIDDDVTVIGTRRVNRIILGRKKLKGIYTREENVGINQGQFDQHVERIDMPGVSSDYKFEQNEKHINLYRDGFKVVEALVEGGHHRIRENHKTIIVFADGFVDVKYNSEKDNIKINGVKVPSDYPSSIDIKNIDESIITHSPAVEPSSVFPATVTYPKSGTSIASRTVKFNWELPSKVPSEIAEEYKYKFNMGANKEAVSNMNGSLFTTKTNRTQVPIRSIPTNIDPIYIKIQATVNGEEWKSQGVISYRNNITREENITETNQQYDSNVSIATITDPVPGSVISQDQVKISWNSYKNADAYELIMGTDRMQVKHFNNSNSIHNNIDIRTQLSSTTTSKIIDIPSGADVIYIRLRTKGWFSSYSHDGGREYNLRGWKDSGIVAYPVDD